MLLVAVLMFETHRCCLPWWDSPSVAFTLARRSLLVWGSKWCGRAWDDGGSVLGFEHGALRHKAHASPGGQHLPRSSCLRLLTEHSTLTPTKWCFYETKQNGASTRTACVCTRCSRAAGTLSRAPGEAGNAVVPALAPPKSLHLRSLHCRPRPCQAQGLS